MLLPLTYYPNPLLRKKSHVVTEFNSQLANLIQDMRETMIKESGIGLAAPQIGKNLRVFIVDPESSWSSTQFHIFINPVLTFPTSKTTIEQEGCLSIPEIYSSVKRYLDVDITAQDLSGNYFTLEATELLARIIQHEFDHVEGVLFIDKILPRDKKKLEENLKIWRKKNA